MTATRLPDGFAVQVDRRVRVLGDGSALLGGSPTRGLAAAGQAGVENVLDILRGGIDSALMGLGHGSVHDLGPDDVLVPAGFARSLGVPPA